MADGYGMRVKRSSARFAAGTAVLGIHVLLALLFLRVKHGAQAQRPQAEIRANILNLLRLPRRIPNQRGPIEETERSRLLPKHLRNLKASGMPGMTLPEVPPVALPYRSKMDWYRAADEVAHSLTNVRRPRVYPGSGEHPKSPYRDCVQQPQFAWDPQPTVVGLDHHLVPYLRLGKYCVITLGSFGCAFGHYPGPNGHLFDSIRNRDPTQDGEPRGLCQ